MGKKHRSRNSGSKTPSWLVPAFIGLVVVVFVFGALALTDNLSVGDSPSGSVQLESNEAGQVTFCGSDTTPDLLINGFNALSPGTAITEESIYRKKDTTSWTRFVTGTEIQGLEAGATYEFVLGINATDFVDNAYGPTFEYTVKCQEDETIEKGMYNDEIETSLTATFYNADDNAAAESFSAGQTQTVSIKLQAGTREMFGNPYLQNEVEGEYPNVLVLSLNATSMDKPEKVYLADGTELMEISVPQRANTDISNTDATEYAYELPVITDQQMRVYMNLNADDTNAPGNDGTAYIYPANHFVNALTGSLSSGIQTEENNAVATDASDSVALDFT